MTDATGNSTSEDSNPLGKDANREPFKETWGYTSVVRMLLYLSGNYCPDIAFAVNQAAHFTHDPKQSHVVGIKKIVCYLISTRDKGLIFQPTNDWNVACYVDADFCGLWGVENADDPIVSKSRTGFIII